MEKILFKEEQRFNKWWILLILGFGLLALIIPLTNELSSQSWNTSSENFSRLVLNGGLVALFIVAVFTVMVLRRLETKITQNEIIIRFPPLKRKAVRIKIQEIEHFEIRKYKPIREFGGRGYCRKGTSGQAYTISGNTGLQLYFKNGKKLLIGTQKKQAIEFAMSKIIGENNKVASGDWKRQHDEGKIGKKMKKFLIILAIEIIIAILIIGIIQLLK